MERKFTCIVDREDEGMAIRRMLKKHFDFSSRLFAKLRHQERVYLNDEILKGYMHPREGDVITCYLPEEESHFVPEDIPVIPVFEDDDLLIIDKPAGYTVHPTKGHPDHTMANGVTKYMQDKGESYKIRFVNRLDMDTTGLLVIGKNSHSQDALVRDMKTDRIQKCYQAIVLGIIDEDELTIDLPIGMADPTKVGRTVVAQGQGRDSVTHVKVLGRYKGEVKATVYAAEDAFIEPDANDGTDTNTTSYSPSKFTEAACLTDGVDVPESDSSHDNLVKTETKTYDGLTLIELRLETGRTHQIRVHMSHIGHPVLGDHLYGGASDLIPRQALHAYKLIFHHPATDELMTVTCPLPEDMQTILDKLNK